MVKHMHIFYIEHAKIMGSFKNYLTNLLSFVVKPPVKKKPVGKYRLRNVIWFQTLSSNSLKNVRSDMFPDRGKIRGNK